MISFSRSLYPLLFPLLLAACQGDRQETRQDNAAPPASPALAGEADMAASNRTSPSPDSLPLHERTPQGAGRVAQAYAQLMQAGRFDEAGQLLADAPDSQTRQAHAVAAAREHPGFMVTLTGPGQSEGAAGTIYRTMPFALHFTDKDGHTVQRTGTVTLRRVNDVPGASEEQLSWRIRDGDLDPE